MSTPYQIAKDELYDAIIERCSYWNEDRHNKYTDKQTNEIQRHIEKVALRLCKKLGADLDEIPKC